MWTVMTAGHGDVQQPVRRLMMLSQQLSSDAERLTTSTDAGPALDRVIELHLLAVSVSLPAGSELLEHVTVVASVAGQLRVLLGANGPAISTELAGWLGPSQVPLGPVETAASLDLAAETLSLSARLALSLARWLRHERLRRVLTAGSVVAASCMGRVVVVGSVAVDQHWAWLAGSVLIVAPVIGVLAARPAQVYAVMVALASAALVPHASGACLAAVHVLTECWRVHRDVVGLPARRRETVETTPRIRKGHRHVVLTR